MFDIVFMQSEWHWNVYHIIILHLNNAESSKSYEGLITFELLQMRFRKKLYLYFRKCNNLYVIINLIFVTNYNMLNW